MKTAGMKFVAVSLLVVWTLIASGCGFSQGYQNAATQMEAAARAKRLEEARKEEARKEREAEAEAKRREMLNKTLDMINKSNLSPEVREQKANEIKTLLSPEGWEQKKNEMLDLMRRANLSPDVHRETYLKEVEESTRSKVMECRSQDATVTNTNSQGQLSKCDVLQTFIGEWGGTTCDYGTGIRLLIKGFTRNSLDASMKENTPIRLAGELHIAYTLKKALEEEPTQVRLVELVYTPGTTLVQLSTVMSDFPIEKKGEPVKMSLGRDDAGSGIHGSVEGKYLGSCVSLTRSDGSTVHQLPKVTLSDIIRAINSSIGNANYWIKYGVAIPDPTPKEVSDFVSILTNLSEQYVRRDDRSRKPMTDMLKASFDRGPRSVSVNLKLSRAYLLSKDSSLAEVEFAQKLFQEASVEMEKAINLCRNSEVFEVLLERLSKTGIAWKYVSGAGRTLGVGKPVPWSNLYLGALEVEYLGSITDPFVCSYQLTGQPLSDAERDAIENWARREREEYDKKLLESRINGGLPPSESSIGPGVYMLARELMSRAKYVEYVEITPRGTNRYEARREKVPLTHVFWTGPAEVDRKSQK